MQFPDVAIAFLRIQQSWDRNARLSSVASLRSHERCCRVGFQSASRYSSSTAHVVADQLCPANLKPGTAVGIFWRGGNELIQC